MRGRVPAVLALLLATQGAGAFAAGRTWSHPHSGGSGVHPTASTHPTMGTPHSHVHATHIRVVPRYVYVAPYVPYYYPSPSYYSTPSYSPAPAYYPSSPESTPAYDPPDSPAYVEPPPQEYAPPPPPPASSAPKWAQPGPYSMEEGIKYRYLCLDTRQFYPDVKQCASGWLTVLPGGGNPPR